MIFFILKCLPSLQLLDFIKRECLSFNPSQWSRYQGRHATLLPTRKASDNNDLNQVWLSSGFVKTRVSRGCSVSQAHKTWSRPFLFKDFVPTIYRGGALRDDPNNGWEGDYIQTGGRVEKCFDVYAYSFQQSLNSILHNSHLFSSREKFFIITDRVIFLL